MNLSDSLSSCLVNFHRIGINVYKLTELSLARQFAVGFGKETTVPAIS